MPHPAAEKAANRPAQPVPSFPGTELVGAAAALFHSAPLWAGAEGRRFLLAVSAGTVGVAMQDPARRERNVLTALGTDSRGTLEVYAPPRDVGSDGVVYVEVYDDGDGLAVVDDGEPEFRDVHPLRQVEGWSRRSRARMTRRLAQLDWSPMYAAGRPSAMVTLTYPGDWTTVAPDGATAKGHLDALLKRWARRWHDCSARCRWEPRKGKADRGCRVGTPWVKTYRAPSTAVRWVQVHDWTEPPCAWKLEFQGRGAPHFHLLIVPPADPTFSAWLSVAWSDVVAHPDGEERRRHRLAGTGLDWTRGARCFDPKRAAVYFSKHGGAAGGKEYQHTVPVEWQEPGKGPGRFWGYRGLSVVVAEVGVPVGEYVALRRTLRRWSQASGLARTVRVPRGASRATGELSYRAVRRPLRYIGHGGLTGGTVLVNDGPAFASALARHPSLAGAAPVRGLRDWLRQG